MSAYVRQPAVGRGDRLLALSVFCILLGLYTATFGGVTEDAGAELRFQTTSALARTGRPALGGTPEATAIHGHAAESEVYPARHVRNEELWPAHGIGAPLFALPFYGLGRLLASVFPEVEARHAEVEGGTRSEYFAHLFVGWRNALLTAGIAALLVASARRLGASRRSAWVAAVAFGVGTYAWPLARSSLVEVQAAFLLFLAFHLIVDVRETFARLTAPRVRTLVGLGLVLGLALLVRPGHAPAVVALAVGAFAVLRAGRAQFVGTGSERLRRRGEKLRWLSLAMAVPLLAAVALLVALDRERFGDPFATFRGLAAEGRLRRGLLAELFAPAGGLLWLAPGVVLAPIGVAVAWRDGERFWAFALLAVGLACALSVGGPDGFFETPTYGPRHLLPLLPFAWLGVALALDAATGPTARVVAGVLFLLGVLGAVPAVLVDAETYRDLALQAARVEQVVEAAGNAEETEPATAAATAAGAEAGPGLAGFSWDWRFAVPWSYWRILRHRVSGGQEVFDAREIFFVDSEVDLVPGRERDRGFRHLCFVDLSLRLDGPGWAVLLLSTLLACTGLALASRGFQPGRA